MRPFYENELSIIAVVNDFITSTLHRLNRAVSVCYCELWLCRLGPTEATQFVKCRRRISSMISVCSDVRQISVKRLLVIHFLIKRSPPRALKTLRKSICNVWRREARMEGAVAGLLPLTLHWHYIHLWIMPNCFCQRHEICAIAQCIVRATWATSWKYRSRCGHRANYQQLISSEQYSRYFTHPAFYRLANSGRLGEIVQNVSCRSTSM